MGAATGWTGSGAGARWTPLPQAVQKFALSGTELPQLVQNIIDVEQIAYSVW
jgi:hypothetical protein